jgi:hypothetical protein
MSHSLAAPDAFQDLVLFALSIGWNKHNHHLAHDFFGGVSEEALRTLIPGSDGSLKVDAYDGVVGRFHDGGEALRMTLAERAELFLETRGNAAQQSRPLGRMIFRSFRLRFHHTLPRRKCLYAVTPAERLASTPNDIAPARLMRLAHNIPQSFMKRMSQFRRCTPKSTAFFRQNDKTSGLVAGESVARVGVALHLSLDHAQAAIALKLG